MNPGHMFSYAPHNFQYSNLKWKPEYPSLNTFENWNCCHSSYGTFLPLHIDSIINTLDLTQCIIPNILINTLQSRLYTPSKSTSIIFHALNNFIDDFLKKFDYPAVTNSMLF